VAVAIEPQSFVIESAIEIREFVIMICSFLIDPFGSVIPASDSEEDRSDSEMNPIEREEDRIESEQVAIEPEAERSEPVRSI
jgi:hypothetical protein